MSRSLRQVLLALAIAGIVPSVPAFSLLGPYASDYQGTVWEIPAIGYNPYGTDIGGPVDLGEGYRWNIRTITYGFDKSFLDYFGQRGVQEVNKAVAILNSLPPVSKMSSNLTEFAENTRRVNYQASSLALIDLKSFALGFLVEEMGLASPERYVWCLRSRQVIPGPATNYFVIMRNFDPATLIPSPYVNGVLYTYEIFEFPPPFQYADAVELLVDPLAIPFTSVASSADGIIAVNPRGGGVTRSSLGSGQFYTGLTRDDVGALRYLFSKYNYNYENLLTNSALPQFGGAWTPVGTGGGTTQSGAPWTPVGRAGTSNVLVTLALRPGVDRVIFKQFTNESLLGNFITITNQYTDIYRTNSGLVRQIYQRTLTQPDILFATADLGVDVDGNPYLARRSDTSFWANNWALNGTVDHTGPGVIQPQVIIYFSNVGPFYQSQFPGFMDQASAFAGGGYFGGWASFDGTTNEPIVYPNGASIEQLELMILNAGQ